MKICISILFSILLPFYICEGRKNYVKQLRPEKFKYVYDPDIDRNVSALISSKGYPVEEHTVQTADGFMLSLQRIPHGRKQSNNNQRKPAIFLQHGLLCSSSDFVINFPNQSLGFLLADAGYDVWLGNTRGNTYSRRHVKYTPNMWKFWNFSFDEMAKYDLPACIDYVLNTTGQKSLTYVGHSQGTTSAFALLSENPEYNKKVKLFIALAPAITVGYITSAIKYIAPFTKEMNLLFWLLGEKEFLPNDALIKYLSEHLCESEEKFICEDIMFLFFGTDYSQLNQTRLAVYITHDPAGTSSKSIIHYAQMVNSKKFVKYDYGIGNLWHYNQLHPPEYNVSKITTPVALLWAVNDKLADPTDVELLKEKLKSMVSDYEVPFPLFNHGDFVFAIHARELIYNHILDLLNKYAG